ncbi:MAG: amylo-alpha-1,6-glucosidase [Bacteroidales bacterium]|nr:amylo-alpha-1,6-glucosidase [Bacteroidales bacterium]
MDYIKFTKEQLTNLEFSLNREILRSNRAGSYACQTLAGCNTRKYHGLLICPQPGIDDDNHVLLSNLDETLIVGGAEFNLSIRRYKGGVYHPRGHKYLREFVIDPVPVITYRVGNVLISKEMIFTTKEDRILLKYSLIESSESSIILRFRPFLAFRNVHFLTRANMDADTTTVNVPQGISVKMYPGYTPLVIQFSKKGEYTHSPDWYYNVEYIKEIERGYEAHEDLFVPGYFDVELQRGESIVFSAGTTETDPSKLKQRFAAEARKRLPRDSYINCLKHSAQQFIVNREGKTLIIAGYPYFGRFSRDTFISLPGLTLTTGQHELCHDVLESMIQQLNGPLFPNILRRKFPVYNSMDAPLWFIWAVQKYYVKTGKAKQIWSDFGDAILQILNGLREGTQYNIHMHEDGLLYGGVAGEALTWMDAIIDRKPVTPRFGAPVEVTALWYNAIAFMLELASKAGKRNSKSFNEWQDILERAGQSMLTKYWNPTLGYLADCIDEQGADFTMRPNQVIAAAMQYSPLPEEIRKSLLSKVKHELLTPRGLRTLSPNHPQYKGSYGGDQISRDLAYHQGSVFPWLLGFFAEGYLLIHGKGGVSFIKNLFYGFEPEMLEHGLCSISEIYDGDPPHKPAGAISQAWSVAELLRMYELIEKYEQLNIQ